MIPVKQRRVINPHNSFVVYVLMTNQCLKCSKKVSVTTPFVLTAYPNTWLLRCTKTFSRWCVQTLTVPWNWSPNIFTTFWPVKSLLDGKPWGVSLWLLGWRRPTVPSRTVLFCWWMMEKKMWSVLSAPLVIGYFAHGVRFLGMELWVVKNSKR